MQMHEVRRERQEIYQRLQEREQWRNEALPFAVLAAGGGVFGGLARLPLPLPIRAGAIGVAALSSTAAASTYPMDYLDNRRLAQLHVEEERIRNQRCCCIIL